MAPHDLDATVALLQRSGELTYQDLRPDLRIRVEAATQPGWDRQSHFRKMSLRYFHLDTTAKERVARIFAALNDKGIAS